MGPAVHQPLTPPKRERQRRRPLLTVVAPPRASKGARMGTILVLVILGSSLAIAGLVLARAFPHTAWWAHDLLVSSGLAFVAVGLAMWILPRVWTDAPQGGRVFIWGTATVALTLVLFVVIGFFEEARRTIGGPPDSMESRR
jgi:hypothetical protein